MLKTKCSGFEILSFIVATGCVRASRHNGERFVRALSEAFGPPPNGGHLFSTLVRHACASCLAGWNDPPARKGGMRRAELPSVEFCSVGNDCCSHECSNQGNA
jgi:hypothetical protein